PKKTGRLMHTNSSETVATAVAVVWGPDDDVKDDTWPPTCVSAKIPSTTDNTSCPAARKASAPNATTDGARTRTTIATGRASANDRRWGVKRENTTARTS